MQSQREIVTGGRGLRRWGCREVAGAKWMDCDEYLEQSTSRMPPGGVYYTLNELAIAAFDGTTLPKRFS